ADRCGNSGSCSQTITVGPSGPAGVTISCPADTQLTCEEPSDPAHTGSATAIDGSGGAVAVAYTDSPTAPNCTGRPGIDRTWSAGNACTGVASCVQHITYV